MLLGKFKATALYAAAVAAALGFVGGCHKSEAPIVGAWNDRRGIEIEFKPDHTFGQSDGLATGKWTFADGRLTLTPETIKGAHPVDYLAPKSAGRSQPLTASESITVKQATRDISLTLSADGKLLTPVDPSISGQTLTKREK